MTHLIHQQYLHAECDGSIADGQSLQQRLPDLYRYHLAPAIERTLNKFTPTSGHCRIEHLEIDLGVLTHDSTGQDWEMAIEEALAQALDKQSLPAGNNTHSITWTDTGNTHYQTEQESLHTAFLHFLQTGSLPWSFHLSSDETLEQRLLTCWKAEPTSIMGQSDKPSLLTRLTSTTVRQRLIRQFSPTLLQYLLERLEPGYPEIIHHILRRLSVTTTPTSELRPFSRILWETAFLHASQQQKPDETRLLQAVLHNIQTSVSFPELQQSTLFQQITQHWPTVQYVFMSDVPQDKPARQPEALPDKLASSIPPTPNRQPPLIPEHDQSASPTWTRKPASDNKPNSSRLRLHPHIENNRTTQEIQPMQNMEESCTREVAEKIISPYAGQTEQKIEALYTGQAGLVLLHPFLPRLFETLGIADGDKLPQTDRALCLLHFLTTGQHIAPEYELALPKVLCNVPLATPVIADVGLTQEEQEEAVTLLEAVIRHWTALRNTSPDGLRGNFLVRLGKLSSRPDGDWLLQVEPQTHDLLLDLLPWGIGMIKLPWMQQILWVEWR